jgi:uncharacterized protein YndB with AHSA1/START domain
MAHTPRNSRTDSASRIIKASPQKIFQAFVDPWAWESWLPPKSMKGRVHVFDFRAGGRYRMELTYLTPDHATKGKTSEHSDVVEGRFLEIVPDERIVQSVTFDSGDPAFAGEMNMTWKLTPVPGGTEVTIICEEVPDGIRPEDHDADLRSTLENLAAFTE